MTDSALDNAHKLFEDLVVPSMSSLPSFSYGNRATHRSNLALKLSDALVIAVFHHVLAECIAPKRPLLSRCGYQYRSENRVSMQNPGLLMNQTLADFT